VVLVLEFFAFFINWELLVEEAVMREIDPKQREEFELQQIRQRPSPYRAEHIGKSIRRLMTRSGIGQTQAAAEIESAWQSVASKQLASVSRPGNLNRGTLQILMQDSSAMQEFQMCKRQLLVELQRMLPHANIKDLKGRLV
jgi:predicted nucleic acid-binding Zn ribbon protein